MPTEDRTPRAAIIIPHYNDVIRLERCLAALATQVRDRSDLEVLVVDNGSDPPLGRDLLDRWPGFRFITETQKGAALARNRGVEESTAPVLLFIDSDCVPDSDWVATALRVSPRASLVGGSVHVFDETPPPRSGAEAFEAVFAFDFRRYIEKEGFSGSGNLVTRREVFDTIGGFRPGLSEDLDWCRRATAAGFELAYAEELRVGHPSRSDWAALRRKWVRLTDETWGLRDRSLWARLSWVLRAFMMPLSALVHLPKVTGSKRLKSWVEKRRAATTLFRLRFARMGWMLNQVLRSR